MKRIGVLSIIIGVLLATTVTTAAAQTGGPTVSQLRQALLTEDDLWAAFEGTDLIEDDSGDIDATYPAVWVDFVGLVTDDFLTIELHDARNGSPDAIVRGLLEDLEAEQVREVTPAGYGTAGVRFRYVFDEPDGERWYGEAAAWRQGQIVVAIVVESLDADACVCEPAELQYNKVVAMFR
ncbi:MAG: hypothetical protein AB7R89_28630 [Dehalococcoidia bacterium]